MLMVVELVDVSQSANLGESNVGQMNQPKAVEPFRQAF